MNANRKLHRTAQGGVTTFILATAFIAVAVFFSPKISSGIPIQAATQEQQLFTARFAAPEYQAEFTPVVANGLHTVSWDKGYLVSSGSGEMKEPVALYDKTGKWLFETPLTFTNAIKIYAQDAVPTSMGTAVVAASAASADGTAADLIVEAGKDGIRRVVRTSPFYPYKVCATNEGTVWAFGHELTANRTAEPHTHYPILREFSFEK